MKKTISIIGGGPGAMLLAAHLDSTQFDVTIYEKNKALGRKFLVAGKGGFNLSHSEEIDDFIQGKMVTFVAYDKFKVESYTLRSTV